MERGEILSELKAKKNILKLIIMMMKKSQHFYRSAEMNFQCLAGPSNVSIDLKYNVLYLQMFV